MTWQEQLHATLTERASCETVAKLLLHGPGLRGAAREECARVASARPPWWVSSQAEDFDRAEPDAAPQLKAAAAIFGTGAVGANPADPAALRALVGTWGGGLGWAAGMDWKADRLTRSQRDQVLASGRLPFDAAGLKSKRAYNRRIRVLRALSDKADRIEHARLMRRLTLVGRSGFAADIPLDRFAADPAAACFVAYITARKNRRREFALSGRENPMDHLAHRLLGWCERREGTDWPMIAMVHPVASVLARLGDEDRGALMGAWWQVMADTAMALAKAWPGDVDRMRMVVRRGMDSSTWNTLASAYNAARAGWLNCLAVGGGLALVEPMCPPKVMRLMAADLVLWHYMSGGDVDGNTKVAAALPFAWDVVAGAQTCTAGAVRQACERAGLDPVASGWTGPRALGKVAEFVPTKELVHGVEIASPEWAAVLRRAGVFGGVGKAKAGAGELRAEAEQHGMVTGSLPVVDAQTGAYLGHT
jgi:hypothetical protein